MPWKLRQDDAEWPEVDPPQAVYAGFTLRDVAGSANHGDPSAWVPADVLGAALFALRSTQTLLKQALRCGKLGEGMSLLTTAF